MIIGPCTERFGHRFGMILLCIVTIVGTIIQVTSKKAAQFIIGRIVVYIGVGIVENVVPYDQNILFMNGILLIVRHCDTGHTKVRLCLLRLEALSSVAFKCFWYVARWSLQASIEDTVRLSQAVVGLL